jgi:UDP-hydrolysing UDP-N-acetyl-D-glucosamine 2-epimerase
VLSAIDRYEANVVIVRPNADTANRMIHAAIDEFCANNPRTRAPVSLPRRAFLSLMRAASAMVGNSSSGIIEAPSFQTPVVNVGQRQGGRVRAANVIDVETNSDAIEQGIRRALTPEFRDSLAGMTNPYGDGRSGPRIAQILATTPLDRSLLMKGFVDL